MHEPHAPQEMPPPAPEMPGGVSRRAFLTRAAAGAGVATVSWFWGQGFTRPERAADVEPTLPGAPGKTFNEREWRTLEAACDRLLPSSPGSPGARDVNAIGYLDAVLQDATISRHSRAVILDGAQKLDARAKGMGAAEFRALPATKQDAAIRVFETFRAKDGSHPGHVWLERMLGYIFEAFFGDPVHGGNPDEIGWTWAGHKPGFPRPKPSQKGWRPTERT